MLNLLLALPLLASLATQGQAVVQEYYIPMPEAQLRDDYLALASTTSSTATSVASIVVLVAGTRIIYTGIPQDLIGHEISLGFQMKSGVGSQTTF